MTLLLRVLALATLGLVLPIGSARSAEIQWQAPAPCPDAAELRFDVERALDMHLTQAAPLHFDVTVEHRAKRYRARLVIGPASGAPRRERELEAADCGSLVEQVIVAIALALDAPTPAARSDEPPSAPRPRASAPDAERAPVDRRPAAGAAGLPSQPWRPGVSGWVLADAGSLPEPAAGLAVAAALQHGRWGVRALGTLLLEQQRAVGLGPGAPGARLGLVTGAASVCAAPFVDRGAPLAASACAGWELGRLWGEGVGVAEARAGGALWSAPRFDLGGSLAFAVTGLKLGALLTVAVPLVRDDFVLRGLGAVHRPRALVGRAALGLEWTL